jgi:hypothetical protein
LKANREFLLLQVWASSLKRYQAEIKSYPYFEYSPFAQIISKNGVDYIKVKNINLMVKLEKL